VPRKQASQPLINDKVCKPCWPFSQTTETDAPDAEKVIKSDACKNLFVATLVTVRHFREPTHVETDVGKSNSKVSPPFTRIHIAASQKLFSRGEWTVLAL